MLRLWLSVREVGEMANVSRALPHQFYGDPADVVERAQLSQLGCRACKSHDVVFDRVVCKDGRNIQQRGVPHVGFRCRWFNDE